MTTKCKKTKLFLMLNEASMDRLRELAKITYRTQGGTVEFALEKLWEEICEKKTV